LLELGAGFSFSRPGRGASSLTAMIFYIDLLFYERKLSGPSW
jgi:predicted nuclease of restriction endonuclease-like (RecB) superfamily